VRNLWLQQLVQQGRINLQKVKGTRNPADVMTKFLEKMVAIELLRLAGVHCDTAEERLVSRGGVEQSTSSTITFPNMTSASVSCTSVSCTTSDPPAHLAVAQAIVS
jgi:hypothetical protein